MRLLFILSCLLMLSAGLLFGGLNAEPITVDFHFVRFESVRSGVALLLAALLAALLGALLAGFALSLSVILPLRRRLRRAYRAAAPRTETADASVPAVLS